MPATACVSPTTYILQDGLSTETQAAPEGNPGYLALYPPHEGKDRGPRARRHPKVPLVTRPSALVQAVTRKRVTAMDPTLAECRSRLQGTRNEDGNVPTPRSVSPHGDRDPGLTPHGDRAHAA